MKEFDVVVRIQFSTLVQVKANSEGEAIEKAIEQYYSGEIMEGFSLNEYYDGLTEVTAEESI